MAKARAIVKRRKAVQNIRKITRTMQLIATARFQKAFNRAVATKPFTQKLSELVSQLAANQKQLEHPLLKVNEPKGRSALLVITSNRGLCGGYNASLLRTAVGRLREAETASGGLSASVDLHVCGKKGIAYFNFMRRPMAAKYTKFEDRPQYAEVEPIAEGFIRQYAAGEIDSVHVVYMQFESTAVQRPNVLQLLPIPSPPSEGGMVGPASAVLYDFTPPPEELLADLLPMTVKTRLFQCFTDAAVSEQVSRMVAMKAATDAGSEMLKQLTQAYNRARQTQITLELLDIVGGAEAIK